MSKLAIIEHLQRLSKYIFLLSSMEKRFNDTTQVKQAQKQGCGFACSSWCNYTDRSNSKGRNWSLQIAQHDNEYIMLKCVVSYWLLSHQLFI